MTYYNRAAVSRRQYERSNVDKPNTSLSRNNVVGAISFVCGCLITIRFFGWIGVIDRFVTMPELHHLRPIVTRQIFPF